MKLVVSSLATAFVAVASMLHPTSSSAQTVLVNAGATWRYHKGTNAPQPDWKTAPDAALNAEWPSGPGGFGYGDGDDATVLSDMRNGYTTVYIRRTFNIPSAIEPSLQLRLTVDYDDAYVAYLDGQEIARSANISGGAVGVEPSYNGSASTTHEASAGSGGNAPAVINLGRADALLAPGNHILALIGINESTTSSDLSLIPDLIVVDPSVCPPNTICRDTNWFLADSPIIVPSSLTIEPGATLTIEPGVVVQLGSGANITVTDGGRLLAEGTSNAPIRFTRSGASGSWGHLVIDGSPGSPETRISHTHFELNNSSPTIEVAGGTALLDHLTFGNTAISYIHVDRASFVISHCHFPGATSQFELVHGTGGIKSGGHGIFYRNFFGSAIGYNDVVDFTGGNRPGPIVEFIENVFTGSDDDLLDLDSTDSWVERNIFLHTHRNGSSPDSSSAVSGGADNADTSEITMIANIVFDCDQTATAKQGNFYTLFNNTVVHQTRVGGIDFDGAVVNVRDFPQSGSPTAFGAGYYLEGNLIYDAEQLVRNFIEGETSVVFSNNIMPYSWPFGGGNSIADPTFKHVPSLAETVFTNWADAQIMWDWLSLENGSPAIGAGPLGADMGAAIPLGVFLAGVPTGTTAQTGATISVGPNRTGSGIPSAGFPNGSGYTAYKWRLDTNSWSAETSIDTPIQLAGLADGDHYIEVSGKRDSGRFQDDPIYGDAAYVTKSKVWTVQSSSPLTIDSTSRSGNTVTITFTAQAGKTYSVFYRDALDEAHPWQKLTDVPSQATTGSYSAQDQNANASASRFYQLVTPAQP